MIGTHISPRLTTEVSPHLIAANTILQLSTLELEQAIMREVNENPALEMVEQPVCRTCGSKLRSGFCVQCSESKYFTSHALSSFPESEGARAEEIDPLSFVQAPLTLAEELFSHLRLTLDSSDHRIALCVVGNLDEHGYLTVSVEELAQMLHVDPRRVALVVGELRSLEPAGIGACTLTECLLLQLERLSEKGITPPACAWAIIEHHLTELGHHQFESIRKALDVPRSEVEESLRFIRTNLHPYPAHHHALSWDDGARGSILPTPSVIIHRSSSGYEVEVVEAQQFLLRPSPLYEAMRQQPEQILSSGDWEHVKHYLERARLFMGQLQRRTLFLQRVMMYLVNYQHDFLDHGLPYLRPLSQKTAAQSLEVHVSMISRAIANKFVQLPSQELVPIHRFFSAELRTQEIIRRIIVNEAEPLSDARIVELLSAHHSIKLTRQMVANYRNELHIPAARQRAALRH